MKVVLIKDVRNMGSNGTVLEVSDGHAVNFLFPRKLAIQATPQAVKDAELRAKQSDDKKAIDADLLSKNIETLRATPMVIRMKANDKGHLYEAVAAPEIAAAAKELAHIDIPEEVIDLQKPIKEVGTYEIPVSSSGKDLRSFSLVIEAE